MTASFRARFQRFWYQVHLWIGIGAMLLLIPIGISGSLLVWHDGLEEMLFPARFAVTGDKAGLAPSRYLAAGAQALGDRAALASLRYPAEAGAPVQVNGRLPGEGRTGFLTVYLDPPTAEVLDVANSNTSLIRLLHNFHGNLLIPEWSGRQIVGWTGVVLTISALSGIYLWWPKRGFIRALGWRRGPKPSHNLHLMIGAWTAIPLAIIAFTGVWISFPQTARETVGLVATVPPPQPQQNRAAMFNAKPVAAPALSADAAVDAATKAAPGQPLATVTLPTDQAAQWRVQFRNTEGPPTTVSVDDKSGQARRQGGGPAGGGQRQGGNEQARAPQASDPAQVSAQFMRRLHDGSTYPLIWQVVVFITGILPALFGVTGLIMYLRRRRNRRLLEQRMAAARRPLPAASPAE